MNELEKQMLEYFGTPPDEDIEHGKHYMILIEDGEICPAQYWHGFWRVCGYSEPINDENVIRVGGEVKIPTWIGDGKGDVYEVKIHTSGEAPKGE